MNYSVDWDGPGERDPDITHPFDQNKDGLWCTVCGEHIAAPWHLEDDDYTPPSDCTNCGWPDEFDPEAV